MTKTVVITGANKSIGFETARQLSQLGHRVWLGARDPKRGEAAAQALREEGHDVRYLDIDVVDDDRVRVAAERVMAEDGKLDVLINNAGIPGTYDGPLDEGVDNVRKVYDTNVFGTLRVSYAFIPLLKAAEQGVIVNVSTGLASFGWLTDPESRYFGTNLLGYNSSKAAVNGLTVSLAKALEPYGIKVNSADPGWTKTDFTGHTGNHGPEDAAKIIVRLATIDKDGPTMGFFNEAGSLPW
ncbi:SDR family NAD(P)-dependent oxidoreductase [uncultured Martelella sp.]|uniref:SDR family NAD(P)-dependent oxidoreductase n=1 Tax=uncultured Martelella sp. TaxID=392331 RepID=UPI0029C70C95|nr:SDR family NAD(P)-dependent oxidoreductase [uncultured Martelella sp.]